MSSDEAKTRVSAWATAHRLPETHRNRWLELPPDDLVALLTLAEELRLRTGQFVAAFETLAEIAARDGKPIVAILEQREMRRIIDGEGSAPGKARALLDRLRVIRFPRLQAMSDRLNARLRALGLPSGIRIILPPDLASDEFRLELAAHGGLELRNLLNLLADKTESLCRIADALGGADEV